MVGWCKSVLKDDLEFWGPYFYNLTIVSSVEIYGISLTIEPFTFKLLHLLSEISKKYSKMLKVVRTGNLLNRKKLLCTKTDMNVVIYCVFVFCYIFIEVDFV